MKSNEFKQFIKSVGTGPKGNCDLSRQQVQRAMNLILTQKVTPPQIAGFLIGWRLKPETIEEFKGGLDSILECSSSELIPNSLELGIPFDGKNDSPYIYPLVAKYLKKFDVNLVVTGDHKIPSKEGVTTKELEANLTASQDYSFFDRSKYCPGLSRLHELRNDLGLRTAFNTLEKFSNVAQSKFCASGVFHKPYVEKYIGIFKDRLDGILLVAGNEGSPELFKKSKCWFVKSAVVEEMIIDPLDFGINLELIDNYSAKDCLDVLSHPSEEILKISALNAAMSLYLMSRVSSVKEGFEKLMQS